MPVGVPRQWLQGEKISTAADRSSGEDFQAAMILILNGKMRPPF